MVGHPVGHRADSDHPVARPARFHDSLAGDRDASGRRGVIPLQPAADRAKHGTGLNDIPPSLRESAEALGLSRWARLRLIELPLASRAILAGIKTAAVINVGTATLGALIGAGGFGQPILTGIRRDDMRQVMLEGAIPAAVLALLVQGAFDLAERFLVPKGLRISRSM